MQPRIIVLTANNPARQLPTALKAVPRPLTSLVACNAKDLQVGARIAVCAVDACG
jgi:hypothetical protein